MQRRLVVTNVSGPSWTVSPLKMGMTVCPKTSVTANLRCVKFQESDGLNTFHIISSQFVYRPTTGWKKFIYGGV